MAGSQPSAMLGFAPLNLKGRERTGGEIDGFPCPGKPGPSILRPKQPKRTPMREQGNLQELPTCRFSKWLVLTPGNYIILNACARQGMQRMMAEVNALLERQPAGGLAVCGSKHKC